MLEQSRAPIPFLQIMEAKKVVRGLGGYSSSITEGGTLVHRITTLFPTVLKPTQLASSTYPIL